MAEVVVIDDSEEIRSICKGVLEAGGHEIFGEAFSMKGAMEIVWQCILEGVTPVLVIDGAFPEEDGGRVVRGQGEKLAKIIRKEVPGAKIISFSFDRQLWGDIEFQKGRDDFRDLPGMVSSLISAHV